ncbi:MAG: hypothetical protein ACI94Y_000640 [Maribacter sp.]|jgi:hypothetical protein
MSHYCRLFTIYYPNNHRYCYIIKSSLLYLYRPRGVALSHHHLKQILSWGFSYHNKI